MSNGRTQFTLNGQRYELSRAVVEGRLSDVSPEAIQKHAVQVVKSTVVVDEGATA